MKKPKGKTFTPDEIKTMIETYGKVLTPEEWAERKSRFTSGPDDISYSEKGVLRV